MFGVKHTEFTVAVCLSSVCVSFFTDLMEAAAVAVDAAAGGTETSELFSACTKPTNSLDFLLIYFH